MRKFTTISKFILLVLFLMPNSIFAQNQTITVNGSQIQISSTLQTVLNQTETIYVKPIFKTSLNTVLNKTPVFVPMFIGLIMQRQELMMKEIITVESVDNLTALEEEIFTFLDQLAKAHNDTNPMNNSYMPGVRLKVLYQNAVKGDDNALCITDFGIDPTSVEIEYLIDRSPNKNIVVDNTYDKSIKVASQDNSVDQTIHYKIQVKDEDKNEINLFGEVAPKAEHGNNNEIDITYDPTKEGANYYGPKQTQGGCQCSEQAPGIIKHEALGEKWYLDCSGDLYHCIHIYCGYNGRTKLLHDQVPYVNGKKNGTAYHWTTDKISGKRYIEMEEDYVDDIRNGNWKIYKVFKGQRYLEQLRPYVNGKLHGIRIVYSYDGRNVKERIRYNNGVLVETYR